MTKLNMLQEVTSAYRRASIKTIGSRAYRESKGCQKVMLWLCTVLFGIAVLHVLFRVHSKEDGMVGLAVVIATIFLFGVGFSFDFAVRAVYQKEFEQYAVLMQEYRKNFQFLRYLLFRDLLLKDQEKFKSLNAVEIRGLLLEKDESIGMLVLQNPFTVMLVSFLTAILGGSASIHESWTSGTMPLVVIIIVMILYLNLLFLPLVETRTHREKELDHFLQWLSAEEPTIPPQPIP